jgi:S1-C subfamily serine protease
VSQPVREVQLRDNDLVSLDLFTLSTAAKGPSSMEAQKHGLLFDKVEPKGIWSKLAIEEGDRILAVNDSPGSGAEILVTILQELKQKRSFSISVESQKRKWIVTRKIKVVAADSSP